MMKGPPVFQSGQERAAPRDAAVESTVGLPDSGSGPMLYQWTKLCRGLVGSAMRLLFGYLPRKTRRS